MEYTVVQIAERHFAGLKTRTGKKEQDSIEKIGAVWQQVSQGGLSSIATPVGPTLYGLYNNYESDVSGLYDLIVGVEVEPGSSVGQALTHVTVPQGQYAKFTFQGDPLKDMPIFWKKVWDTPLNRAYTCDFEEYLDHKRINIYIALV